MVHKRTIQVRVNDAEYEREVEVRKTLADFLREDLGLRGTHLGCEHGVCGACTIMFDDVSVRSCILYAVQADGATITQVDVAKLFGVSIPIWAQELSVPLPNGGKRTLTARVVSITPQYLSGRILVNINVGF